MEKKKLKQLADYAVREGLEHSEDGQWAVSYEELLYHFGVDVSDTNENGKLLEEELRQREEINELIMTEDCIEMTWAVPSPWRMPWTGRMDNRLWQGS